MAPALAIFAFLLALGALAYATIVAMRIDDKCHQLVEARLQGFRAEIKKRSEEIQVAASRLRANQSDVDGAFETCLGEIRSLKRRIEELEQKVQQASVSAGARMPHRAGRSVHN